MLLSTAERSRPKTLATTVVSTKKEGITYMSLRQSMLKRGGPAVGLVMALALCCAASASAHSGEYAKFNYCPSTNPEVFKCLLSVTTGGEIVLGKKTTPITNPVTLQGGFSATNREKDRISKFYGATNEITLSKTPEPVPGGLAGLVDCKKISNGLERIACELALENGVTGVNATLELAAPASAIELSEYNLLAEEGLALKLPVKIHLENPFLGSSCYIGSDSAPIYWNLTTGTTSPPAGFAPMTGTAGLAELKDEGNIAQLTGAVLDDNDWAAPEPSGCVEPFSALLDPIIGLELGLPDGAGENSAELVNTIDDATPTEVNAN
jgi:hypothetical protein